MNFKEIVSNDINNLFFNTNEFASIHLVNNKNMPVVIDSYKLDEIKNKAQYADEIGTAELLIYIKLSDLGYIPTKDNIIEFDKEIYRVLSASKTDIVLEIILGANV